MTDSKENEDDESKKPKEILTIQDDGSFTHSTGDTYEGGFEIRKKEKLVKMHGKGTYRTHEGDTYKGVWDNDRLGGGEEVTISYTDGSQYIGNIKDWSYLGNGKYTYPDKSKLECEFADNCPVGNLKLRDPNGYMWLGQAEQGFAWLHPVNHFYNMLEKPKELVAEKSSRDTAKSKTSSKTKNR